jgi:hypothetical protein
MMKVKVGSLEGSHLYFIDKAPYGINNLSRIDVE